MEQDVQQMVDTIHYLCARAVKLDKEGNAQDAKLLMEEAEYVASALRNLRNTNVHAAQEQL